MGLGLSSVAESCNLLPFVVSHSHRAGQICMCSHKGQYQAADTRLILLRQPLWVPSLQSQKAFCAAEQSNRLVMNTLRSCVYGAWQSRLSGLPHFSVAACSLLATLKPTLGGLNVRGVLQTHSGDYCFVFSCHCSVPAQIWQYRPTVTVSS